MGDLLKSVADAGPGVCRFLLASAFATIVAGLVYDRFIRGDDGPSARDVAPMLVVIGVLAGAVMCGLLRRIHSR